MGKEKQLYWPPKHFKWKTDMAPVIDSLRNCSILMVTVDYTSIY